jgi:hypothetical protein
MASRAEKRIVKFVFSGQGGPSVMDVTKLAQDVLSLALARGVLSGSLERREEGLRGLLSEIGQVALQQQQDQQTRLGYEGSSRVCQGCGKDQKFVGYRERTLETQLGCLKIKRAYYHCLGCGNGCMPYDQAEGLGPRAVSVSLAKVVVELAEEMPFRKAKATLAVLLNLPCRRCDGTGGGTAGSGEPPGLGGAGGGTAVSGGRWGDGASNRWLA